MAIVLSSACMSVAIIAHTVTMPRWGTAAFCGEKVAAVMTVIGIELGGAHSAHPLSSSGRG